MLSTGQIEFIKGGIAVNIRSDGRKNNEVREVKLLKSHLICTSGSCKYEGEITIYTGIKLELGDQSQIKINVSSMKRTNDEKQKAQYLQELLESLYKTDMSELKVGQKGWVLVVEVFLLCQIDIAYLEAICISINEAMTDLKIPTIKVTKNLLTEIEEYELLPNEPTKSFKCDKIYVVGKVGTELVKDMSFEEFYSVDQKLILVQGRNGNNKLRTFDSCGFDADDLMRVLVFIK
ncbi:unnamed protein product [Paramecium primaurelia]|uniref:Uncharacterized protein n=1 Tax=Paramecium primaurelia TaxID=5886 RepID=A0A8S1LMY3_PARPR|nr:unnamed protein product [Paramecium primaurelia]